MEHKKITELCGVQLKPRIIIPPKASVSVATPEDRAAVMRAVRKVMAEHRDVLIALKDR